MKSKDYSHSFFYLLLSFGFLISCEKLSAQTDSSALVPFPVEQQVQVDFLSHYYEQDGNHSAVTGGLGTEELVDIGGQIEVIVPLDSVSRMEIASSLNNYTSASTDNIDSYVSSASRKDNRVFIHVGYGKDEKTSAWSAGAGGSFESDYLSTSLTGSWAWRSEDGLRELSVRGSIFLDTWLVIFPEELRAPGLASVPTNKRRSFQSAITWSQPLSPKLQFSATLEPVFQQGLLSTPFHRVYFPNELLPKIERLPSTRFKLPVGFRLHYYLSDFLVSRLFYRFYWDTFGILAHTTSLELPIKPFTFLSIYPFYRFHWQQGADWFQEFGLHDPDAAFYTSDFDLSGFYSHKVGVGVSLFPLYGILRGRMSQVRIGVWETMDIRASRYFRSDGLTASSISLGVNLRI